MLIQAKAAKTAAGSGPAPSAARPSAIPALAAARIRLDAGPAAAARHSPRGVATSPQHSPQPGPQPGFIVRREFDAKLGALVGLGLEVAGRSRGVKLDGERGYT